MAKLLWTPDDARKKAANLTRFDLSSKPAKIAFKGDVTPLPYSPQLDGKFEINIPSTAGLADWAGQALPPELADLQSIAVKGVAKYTFDGIDVDAAGNVVFKDKSTDIKLIVKSEGDPMGGTPVEIDGGITSELITASYKGTATLGLKPLVAVPCRRRPGVEWRAGHSVP